MCDCWRWRNDARMLNLFRLPEVSSRQNTSERLRAERVRYWSRQLLVQGSILNDPKSGEALIENKYTITPTPLESYSF